MLLMLDNYDSFTYNLVHLFQELGVEVRVFRGLPQGLEVGRYHSLAATRVPDELAVTARSDDGEVMGVRHCELPIEGVQFHPESVLTPLGKDLLRNFLDA